MKEASRAGLITRPLTQKVVEKHLDDLGIEAEFGTHSQMRGLSGAAPPFAAFSPPSRARAALAPSREVAPCLAAQERARMS